MDDRRSAPRQLACIPADIEHEESSHDVALIRDISATGARLVTQSQFDVDEMVMLQLYLPSEKLPASGRVVRVETSDPASSEIWRWEIAVEFAVPIDDYAEEIDALCRRQEAQGLLKR